MAGGGTGEESARKSGGVGLKTSPLVPLLQTLSRWSPKYAVDEGRRLRKAVRLGESQVLGYNPDLTYDAQNAGPSTHHTLGNPRRGDRAPNPGAGRGRI